MGNKKKRISNFDRTAENDMHYRGPLSYRHLLIIGWLCISFLVIGLLCNTGIKMAPDDSPRWMYTAQLVSSIIGSFAIPLFLFANFCIILDHKRTYKSLLLKYGGLSLLIVVAYLLLFRRYAVGILNIFIQDEAQTMEILKSFISYAMSTGSLIFNLFIDLFLCTLFMFFLNYEPEKGFFASHKTVFRLLAILPVAYEVGSLIIRIGAARETINPSFYVFPFLTTKPPMSFVMFVSLALFIKIRETRFKKRGKTKEQYEAFLATNTNSFQFSLFATIVLIVTCLIDVIVFAVLTINYTNQAAELVKDADLLSTMTDEIAMTVYSWGFGKHFELIVILPFILLLSYTRNPKNPKADMLIPIGGLVIALLVTLEGIFNGILMFAPQIQGAMNEISTALVP